MPVWPICFCSCWAMPPPRPNRLPAARIPMSFIVAPESASAPRAASAPRSTTSLSGCLPNLVMWIPRIQMSSLLLIVVLRFARCSVDGFETEADRLGSVGVGAHRIGGQPQLHAERDVLGIGWAVDHVAAHARAVAIDD